MIDAHCHFDMYPNPVEIVNRCERDRIITIGMTNLPSHFELGYPHISKCRYVRLSLGMHPLMAKEASRERLKFSKLMDQTSYIGEVGLDFSPEGFATKEMQIENFEFVLSAIKGRKKILSLHSRRAERMVLELIQKHNVENAIFHWYSGDTSIIKKIVDRDYFFSINPAMISSNNGQKIIASIPLDKILTETDGPYTQFSGRTTTPQDITHVITYLSQLHSLPFGRMSEIIDQNFKSIINRIR